MPESACNNSPASPMSQNPQLRPSCMHMPPTRAPTQSSWHHLPHLPLPLHPKLGRDERGGGVAAPTTRGAPAEVHAELLVADKLRQAGDEEADAALLRHRYLRGLPRNAARAQWELPWGRALPQPKRLPAPPERQPRSAGARETRDTRLCAPPREPCVADTYTATTDTCDHARGLGRRSVATLTHTHTDSIARALTDVIQRVSWRVPSWVSCRCGERLARTNACRASPS